MFQVSNTSNFLKIRLSATLDNVERAAEQTKKFLTAVDLRDQIFNMILVMREALANAIVHGCKTNSWKTISYSLCFGTEEIVMEVADEGPGFDWRSFLMAEPRVLQERGWGLFIMKKYSTEIKYNEKGNKLTLTKRLDSHHP